MNKLFGVSFLANGRLYQFMTAISAKELCSSSIDVEINKAVISYKLWKNITSVTDEGSVSYAEN